MYKYFLLMIIFLTIATHTICKLELSELASALNQLQILNEKISPKLPKYTVPSAEFYNTLIPGIDEALDNNFRKLETFGNNASIQIIKYMISVSKKLYQAGDRATNLLMLLELFDRLQEKYNIDDNIIITSVSTGDAVKEEILLRTLYHCGYRSVKFYAIDPATVTIQAIQNFKNDPVLKHYKYYQFYDTKPYVETIILGQKELPHACLTYFPNIYQNALRSYDEKTHNICHDRFKGHPLTTMIILPHYFKELSIITLDTDLSQGLNRTLSKQMNTTFDNIKQYLPTILHKPYKCEQNVLLNFIEIIKLASTIHNDCIAYYKSGNDIDTYYNIASKSIAQLYLETASNYQYYLDFSQIDLKKFQLLTYNSSSNQFETVSYTTPNVKEQSRES